MAGLCSQHQGYSSTCLRCQSMIEHEYEQLIQEPVSMWDVFRAGYARGRDEYRKSAVDLLQALDPVREEPGTEREIDIDGRC